MADAVVTFEEGAARASLLLFPFFSLALVIFLWRFTEIENIGKLKLADTDAFLYLFILFFETTLISYFAAFSLSTIPCVIGECQNSGDFTETILAWAFVGGWPLVFTMYALARATNKVKFGFVVFVSGRSLVTNLTPEKKVVKVVPQPVPTTTENPLGWTFTIADS